MIIVVDTKGGKNLYSLSDLHLIRARGPYNDSLSDPQREHGSWEAMPLSYLEVTAEAHKLRSS